MKVVQGSCVRWSKPQLKMSLKWPKLETENQKHSWNSVRRNTTRSRRDPCFYQPRCVSVCVSLCTLWKCNTMWYIIVRSDKTVLNYVCDVSLGAVCHVCADAKLMPVSCSYVKKLLQIVCPCGIALFFICYQIWVCYSNNMKRSHEMWRLWSNNKTLLRNHYTYHFILLSAHAVQMKFHLCKCNNQNKGGHLIYIVWR